MDAGKPFTTGNLFAHYASLSACSEVLIDLAQGLFEFLFALDTDLESVIVRLIVTTFLEKRA